MASMRKRKREREKATTEKEGTTESNVGDFRSAQNGRKRTSARRKSIVQLSLRIPNQCAFCVLFRSLPFYETTKQCISLAERLFRLLSLRPDRLGSQRETQAVGNCYYFILLVRLSSRPLAPSITFTMFAIVADNDI